MNTIILQIIEKDLRDNDKDLAIEKEKTKQQEIEERIQIQCTEQIRLQIVLANNTHQAQPKQQNKRSISSSQRTLDFFFSKK